MVLYMYMLQRRAFVDAQSLYVCARAHGSIVHSQGSEHVAVAMWCVVAQCITSENGGVVARAGITSENDGRSVVRKS